MKISHFSIHHPVTTTMATCLVVILGAFALTRLPVDLMPDITRPVLTISAEYEDASPEEIEELLTRPIEEAVSSVAGVEEVSSVSSEGRSRVRVSFSWGTDLAEATNDIRDRLDRVSKGLPEEATRPSIRKFNPADFPILILGVASDLDPTALRNLVDEEVQYKIEQVRGVAAVGVHGGNEREIHVDLIADKMKALGIPLDQIVRRIREGNVNIPAGSITRGNLDVRIRTPGAYTSLAHIRDTVVAIVDEAPVLVGDIADVVDSWKERTNYVLINGKPGIRLAVNKQSGSNTVDVARGVLREVAKINRNIPQIYITTIINTSKYIEQSLSNMTRSALYGGILAAVVLLFFLRDLRSTAVIAAAIPASVIATFLLIYFGGFTLNIMTIGGLALGIGMLVDNAIVVVENILRLRDGGCGREEAALKGSDEVARAILASTLTTLAVFFPLIFMRGMAGIMFKQLALVVSFALLCSLVVAMSLVPMLAAKFLSPTSAPDQLGRGWIGRASRWSGGLLTDMEESYKRTLHWALDNRALVALGCVFILAASAALVPLVGSELMPKTDEGEVRVNGEMAVGTRIEVLGETFDKIHQIVVKSVPEMESSETFVGGKPWRPGETNRGEIRIALKAQAERTRSDEEIAAALGRKLRNIPGVTIRTRSGQGLFLLRMATRGMERLSIEIYGHDLDTADALAKQVALLLKDVPGISDTRFRQSAGAPEEHIHIDRRKAEEMHLSVAQIGSALQTILAGARAGEYREGGDEFRILARVKDAKNLTLEKILDLTVTNAIGEPIVLRNVVTTSPRSGPVQIERTNQHRVVEVRVNIRGRDMSSVVADVRERLKTLVVPRGFTVDFGGDYAEQQKAFSELLMTFAFAVLLVYMVMACLFESLRDPFVVMFAVPFAAIGVILALFLTDTTFNIQSYIGCIMLTGIVVNNAILLVDHTNLLRRREGMGLREAIEEAGRRRLRPILMTALTTSLALTPLAFGMGEGGEAQAPMARAVIGGLLSSTLITLVLVPVVYSVFERRPSKAVDDVIEDVIEDVVKDVEGAEQK